MRFLTKNLSLPFPHPPQMNNDGNYILSLSQFTRWLANIAENEYGVEIYPGFAGSQLLLSPTADAHDPWGNKVRSVQGVITNEVGLARNFTMKSSFEPGMAFRAKVTLLGEGAHGSLSKQAISMYQLRKEAQPQTYGIGLKEVWRVDPENYQPGLVNHFLGWPLAYDVYGGGFEYHMDDGLVTLGIVIGLDYKNPYLNPYRELQVRISFMIRYNKTSFWPSDLNIILTSANFSLENQNDSPTPHAFSTKEVYNPSLDYTSLEALSSVAPLVSSM